MKIRMSNSQLKKAKAIAFNKARADEVERMRLIEQDKIDNPKKYEKVKSVENSEVVKRHMSFPAAFAESRKCLEEIKASK